MQKHSHLRRWGAIYLLSGLFVASWFGQFIFELVEFSAQQSEHGQAFSWSDFIPVFFSSTFENWQSEWLQLVFQGIVLLGFKHRIFKADAEDTEILNQKLDRILDRLKS